MRLKVTELQAEFGDSPARWRPAWDADAPFRDSWWSQPVMRSQKVLVFSDDRGEVARVKLDDQVDLSNYPKALHLGAWWLEIVYIEVRGDLLGRDIGPTVLEMLADRYPNRRLVLRSMESSETFWEKKVRWQRYVGSRGYPPLFVQPNR